MKEKYKFELGDLRAFITVVNVMLIMKYGLSVSWIGLSIALIGLTIDIIKYFRVDTSFRVNSALIHKANVVLNFYFMCCAVS